MARCFGFADEWWQFWRVVALGACDFREPGNAGQNVQRRKRLAFWETVLTDTDPQRVTIHRDQSDLDGFRAWVRKTVCPTLQAISDKGDIPVDVLWCELMQGVETTTATFKRQAVDEWLKELGAIQ